MLLLCALSQGKSDPALEQHLSDLREQNAELAAAESSDDHSGSGQMQAALAAARRLASTLGSGGGSQELVQQAMSVLDAVNKQLYGMLDSGAAASADGKSTDNDSGRNVAADEPKSRRSEDRGKTSAAGRSYGDDEDDGENGIFRLEQDVSASPGSSSSPLKRNSAAEQARRPSPEASAARPAPSSSKRFRFGL